jgi:hypothetical protein
VCITQSESSSSSTSTSTSSSSSSKRRDVNMVGIAETARESRAEQRSTWFGHQQRRPICCSSSSLVLVEQLLEPRSPSNNNHHQQPNTPTNQYLLDPTNQSVSRTDNAILRLLMKMVR